MASATILSDNGVTSGSAGLKTGGGNDGTLLLQTTTAGGVATTAMTVDNAQNVGVGLTPAGWGSGRTTIEIAGTTTGNIAFNGNNTNGYQIWNNSYFSSGNFYKYNGAASNFGASGTGFFWNAAPVNSSGSNAACTFTQILAVTKGASLALEGATVQTGTGISFPATQSASSDANTLDDYEEGTWTPALNATGMVYSAQIGTYTKVGRSVTLQFYLTFTTWSSAAGDVIISGLPFAALSTTGGYQEYSIPYFTQVTLPSGCTVLGGEIGVSTSNIYLYGMGSAVAGYSKLQYGTAITNTGTSKLLLATFTYQSA